PTVRVVLPSKERTPSEFLRRHGEPRSAGSAFIPEAAATPTDDLIAPSANRSCPLMLERQSDERTSSALFCAPADLWHHVEAATAERQGESSHNPGEVYERGTQSIPRCAHRRRADRETEPLWPGEPFRPQG